MLIAVVGGRDAPPPLLAAAEAIGREIARQGHTLICGGLTGVMEAACRGARAEGGHTIGVLPGLDPAEANPYVEFVIPTGLNTGRNVIVALSGAAMIAVGGAFGTLSEVAYALQFGRPVVGLETWLIDDGSGREYILRATDPADAVRLAVAAAGGDAR